MSRNGAEALHPAIAAGLLALKGNGLSDRTDGRWVGLVKWRKWITAQAHWGAARLWAACLNAGKRLWRLNAPVTIHMKSIRQRPNNTLSSVALETFGDVSAMEDRLQWNIRPVP
jgi:hypothetical protein